MLPWLIVLAIILILYIKLKIQITYDAKNFCIILKVGFLKFRLGKKGIGKVINKVGLEEKNKKDIKQKDIDKVKLKKTSKFIKLILADLRKYLQDHIIIDKLHFSYHFGLGDAALTGIYAGTVYGLAYSVFAYLDHNFTIVDKQIEIKPDFNQEIQDIDFDCIFYIRLVHIITIILTSFKVLIKNYNWFKNK